MLPSSQPISQSQTELDRFLVCGLGSLGQHCVAVLKEYGTKVSAIDETEPKNWEIPDLPYLIEDLLIGDCRLSSILEQAQIRKCRAVLLVTGNERVNTEAALAARSLNPKIRLLVRSDKQNLNQLLNQNLGNFAAFEPTQLSASAFALAALGSETLGYFTLEERLFRVVKQQIQAGERWCDRWWVYGLNSSTRRVLSYTKHLSEPPQQFYQWEPESVVRAGDTLIYIELTNPFANLLPSVAKPFQRQQRWKPLAQRLTGDTLKETLRRLWKSTHKDQTWRVAILCSFIVLILLLCGTVLFGSDYSMRHAFSTTVALLLGGYSDLFGTFDSGAFPGWLQFFSIGLTLAGTALVGVLYALLTETLLTSKLQFFTTSRPPIPQQDHIVLIGLERVGQRIATLLQELKQPLVGISALALSSKILPEMPLIVDTVPNALSKANLLEAKSIIVTTEDDLQNLEFGLMAHTLSPRSRLVIRTYDQHFSDNVARLFPYAQVLCGSALSAEVFAAAAFGENILSLFHWHQQTVLVTEYRVEARDTLNKLFLAEIAYGYGVVPILYQRDNREVPELMPSEDIRLYVGDRLVVLATSQSLQRIERGELSPRQWQVRIEKALNSYAISEGANLITLIAGCSFSTASKIMNDLPSVLPRSLYQHQAQRLIRKLSEINVVASLVFTAEECECVNFHQNLSKYPNLMND